MLNAIDRRGSHIISLHRVYTPPDRCDVLLAQVPMRHVDHSVLTGQMRSSAICKSSLANIFV